MNILISFVFCIDIPVSKQCSLLQTGKWSYGVWIKEIDYISLFRLIVCLAFYNTMFDETFYPLSPTF